MTTNNHDKPVDEVRLGRITATIWRNRTTGRRDLLQHADHPPFSGAGTNWDRSPSFGRDDLLTVAKVADIANTRIHELQAEAPQRRTRGRARGRRRRRRRRLKRATPRSGSAPRRAAFFLYTTPADVRAWRTGALTLTKPGPHPCGRARSFERERGLHRPPRPKSSLNHPVSA